MNRVETFRAVGRNALKAVEGAVIVAVATVASHPHESIYASPLDQQPSPTPIFREPPTPANPSPTARFHNTATEVPTARPTRPADTPTPPRPTETLLTATRTPTPTNPSTATPDRTAPATSTSLPTETPFRATIFPTPAPTQTAEIRIITKIIDRFIEGQRFTIPPDRPIVIKALDLDGNGVCETPAAGYSFNLRFLDGREIRIVTDNQGIAFSPELRRAGEQFTAREVYTSGFRAVHVKPYGTTGGDPAFFCASPARPERFFQQPPPQAYPQPPQAQAPLYFQPTPYPTDQPARPVIRIPLELLRPPVKATPKPLPTEEVTPVAKKPRPDATAMPKTGEVALQVASHSNQEGDRTPLAVGGGLALFIAGGFLARRATKFSDPR